MKKGIHFDFENSIRKSFPFENNEIFSFTLIVISKEKINLKNNVNMSKI